MGFLNKVINTHSNRKTKLEKIAESKLPVVIYGAGLSGSNIHNYLQQKNIQVVGFAVDKGYGENSVMSGLPVETIEKYDSEYEGYCVIIAIQNQERAIRNLQIRNSSKIKSVYTLCDMSSFLGLVYDYDYVRSHEKDFENVYYYLSDDLSKHTMIHYVNSIITNTFDFNEAMSLYQPDQYFPKGVVPPLSNNEVFVDCGAYDGDTLVSFMERIPDRLCKRYYAIEPDTGNCTGIQNTIISNQFKNVEVVNKGVWDKSETLKFTGGATNNSCISSTGTFSVVVDSIDNLIFPRDNVTFIKMDVQGVELRALKGAEQIIKRDKPNLAICVYHKPEDLFEIPLYIKNIVPEYKLYMRHHEWSLIETVLYAILQ